MLEKCSTLPDEGSVVGVDFKVEVLLGVSIPFVGTVGKWFKARAFCFADCCGV